MTVMSNNPLAPPLAAPVDGRQSEQATAIRRGAVRLLRAHGYAALAEMPLPNGRRADLVGLSEKGTLWILEIKSSVNDFRTDAKWPEYRDYSDWFSFAVAPDFPHEILPEDVGLVIADRFGGEIARSGENTPLPAARRRALTLKFARLAAERFSILEDPDLSTRADSFRAV